MQTILMIFQMVIAVLLALVIMLQNRGTGLSATFGGSGGFYSSKRGVEKVLFNATVILGILFVANSLLYLFV